MSAVLVAFRSVVVFIYPGHKIEHAFDGEVIMSSQKTGPGPSHLFFHRLSYPLPFPRSSAHCYSGRSFIYGLPLSSSSELLGLTLKLRIGIMMIWSLPSLPLCASPPATLRIASCWVRRPRHCHPPGFVYCLPPHHSPVRPGLNKAR